MALDIQLPRADELPPPPADPIEGLLRLWRGLRQLWDYLDEAERTVKAHNNGRPICMEQCGMSCQRSLPIVSKLEVSYMTAQLADYGLVEDVKRRVRAWLTTPNPRLRSLGLPQKRRLSPAQLQALREDNAVLQEGPCPFLDEEQRCVIHPVRPLICRSYGVTLPADTWCPRPLVGLETANARNVVAKDTPLGMKIGGVLRGTWLAMRHFGRSDLAEVGPLPTLMAEAMMEKEVVALRDAGRIQDAKMGKGMWALPDLFGEQRYGL